MSYLPLARQGDRTCFVYGLLFLSGISILSSTSSARAQNSGQTTNSNFAASSNSGWALDGGSRKFNAPSIIPENVGYGVDLVDMSLTEAGQTFEVTNTNSAGVPNMFVLRHGRYLQLNNGLSLMDRKKFDFESYPVFEVDVAVKEGTRSGDTLTIRIPLSDANDEPPRFVMEPSPYLAQVGSDVSPWTIVYQLTATDEDGHPDLLLGLVEVEPKEYFSRFRLQLDSNTGSQVKGSIVVAGSLSLPESQELSLIVTVEDRNAIRDPQVAVADIQVLVGVRSPQFYSTEYTGYISESVNDNDRNRVTTEDNSPLVLKVVNFDPSTAVQIMLLELDGTPSTRFQITTNNQITNREVIDYEKTHSVMLMLEATNTGTDRKTTSQILINIKDENDHPPEFTKDNYFVTVLENVPINDTIMRVTAGDQDSGENQDLEFVLPDNDNFYMDTELEGNVYVGKLRVKRQLDYDAFNLKVPELVFPVLVRDKGDPPKTATAQIIVTLENVNDNPPEITVDGSVDGEIGMIQTLLVGSVVTVVQARDKDWDGVTLSFGDGASTQDIFCIDQLTGVIKTIGPIDVDRKFYNLTLEAVDDGACCGGAFRLTTTSHLIVNVVNINIKKPEFESCDSYDMRNSVWEGSKEGTSVITVTATDDDKGENGRVIYKIDETNSPFQIDPGTGVITVKGVINREKHGYQQVTVVGRNPGDVPLMVGWCSFRVKIKNKNNNAPVFSLNVYEEEVLSAASSGAFIVNMLAADADPEDNEKIKYELFPEYDVPTGNPIFSIDENTGKVTLARRIPSGVQVGHVYEHLINVTDQGVHPGPLFGSTKLKIKVVDEKTSRPRWIDGPAYKQKFYVSEAEIAPQTITNLNCQSDYEADRRVNFFVYDAGGSVQTSPRQFKVETDDTVQLVTQTNLDFEERQEYIIHVVCQDRDLENNDALLTLTIIVTDANDQSPRFVGLVGQNKGYLVGSAAENADAGTFVAYLQAVDDDTNPPFKNITFAIDGEDHELFSVHRVSDNQAKLLTNVQLDRERKDKYNVRVVAQDGAPSTFDKPKHNIADRQILIDVTDVNDNAPTFNETTYRHKVSESADLNALVFSVTAHDVDEVDKNRLDYTFVEGNQKGVFSVLSGSGEIRVARKLDYDAMTDKTYRLELQVTDQGAKHNATTMVEITILDVNDNPPEFTQKVYEVRNEVEEHDDSVTKENPRNLTRVTAKDNDGRQQTNIEYFLLNPSDSTKNLFSIDRETGDVFLTGVLDRDRLTPFYTVAVKATDERMDPLVGYAEVKVYPTDVNDKPVFNREDVQAIVDEHSPRGTVVTTVTATDNDEGDNGKVKYKLATPQLNNNRQYFTIGETSGTLLTSVDRSVLDRERMDRLFVTVIAYDSGSPSLSATARVTVILRDTNDHAPRFLQNQYNMSISESVIGKVVQPPIRVVDEDVVSDNRQLIYSIHRDGSGHFFVQSSSNDQGAAFIGVKSENPLDYEREQDRLPLTFDLQVADGEPNHSDSTSVVVTVEDYNDNSPVFVSGEGNLTLLDGTKRDTYVTQFKATDADVGKNAEIVFSISRESDPRYEFYVHPDNGNVRTRKDLDREKGSVIELVVIATDKGEPQRSTSATLTITLTDTNDNAPQFKEQYRPKVEENVANSNKLVVEIVATDPDKPEFGPPFGFKLPPGCTSTACKSFRLELNAGGDGGHGTARILTSLKFDRESQKEYRLPIVMWDMRDKNDTQVASMTSTSTLTIVIGDQNDNQHFPGHQDIRVNNYRGTKGPKEIGRVYVKDPDDWDLPDKTFTTDLSPTMAMYFSVAQDTGMISMFDNIPPNKLQPFPTYDFNVKVYDKKFKKTVTSSVSVTVDDLPDEAVWKSGSVTLAGITAEEFIVKPGNAGSKYDIFRNKLSSILGYPNASYVDMVSIQDSEDGLDLRFSAHGSPYLNPSQVESAMMLHQKDFEDSLGVTVVMLPINHCMEEVYDVGCSNVLDVTQEANLVNANGTSYVGVRVRTQAVPECLDCTFPTPDTCTGGYCYNGGTCLQDDWGKLTCQCHPGFDGPRCQQRRHHFDGSSVAFYPSLSICAAGRTMFDFISLEEDGLIMHSGDVKAQEDFFIFELQSGYPRLRINLGSSELVLTLDGKDQSGALVMGKLNDGQWHHIDIDRNGQHVQMTVDKCRDDLVVPSPQGVVQDWTPCRASGYVPGLDFLLNTPGFLTVGGPYPSDSGLPSKGFSGCLKDLVHNTKLYDLSYKAMPSWNSGKANCPREDKTCGDGTACGKRADCVTEWLPSDRVVLCTCHPGWKGSKCAEETPVRDFDTASFLKWKLGQELIESSVRRHRLSFMFRTRQLTGTLFSLTNDQLDSIVVQLSSGELTVVYTTGAAGGDTKTLVLKDARAATGQWHTLVVERHGAEFSLSLDNGEGRNYRYLLGQPDDVVMFESMDLVSAGARIDHVIQGRVNSADHKDLDLVNTCITDVRYNDVWMPMEEVAASTKVDGLEAVLVLANNVQEGCSREDCVPDECGPDTKCVSLWEEQICRPSVMMCGAYICHNKGVCVTVNGLSSCQCVYPWVGASCNLTAAAVRVNDDDDDVLAAGAIAGVVIGILLLIILLVLIILFIACRRRGNDKKELMDDLEDDFARENVMYYDEEGAGEKDCDGYNLSTLRREQPSPPPRRIPVDDGDHRITSNVVQSEIPRGAAPSSNIRQFIDNNLDKMEDPNGDQMIPFEDEGSGSTAGSLSSLSFNTGSDSSQEYDYLEGWGPKFSRLADMYGSGSS